MNSIFNISKAKTDAIKLALKQFLAAHGITLDNSGTWKMFTIVVDIFQEENKSCNRVEQCTMAFKNALNELGQKQDNFNSTTIYMYFGEFLK